jgi:hypothetical protein
MRRTLIALPALALLAACDGLFFAELEIPTACVTLVSQDFAATPPGTPLVRDIAYDLDQQLPTISEPNVDYELRLTEMEIALSGTSGVTDFGGIEQVSIQALPPAGSTLAPITVVTYQKPPPPAEQHPTAVSAVGRSNIDLGPYLEGGQLRLQATASGTLPETPWTADVTGCFYLKVKLDYGKFLK